RAAPVDAQGRVEDASVPVLVGAAAESIALPRFRLEEGDEASLRRERREAERRIGDARDRASDRTVVADRLDVAGRPVADLHHVVGGVEVAVEIVVADQLLLDECIDGRGLVEAVERYRIERRQGERAARATRTVTIARAGAEAVRAADAGPEPEH